MREWHTWVLVRLSLMSQLALLRRIRPKCNNAEAIVPVRDATTLARTRESHLNLRTGDSTLLEHELCMLWR